MTESLRFTISGRVQGVGFRAATWQVAQTLGINGWVRNLPDGRVEVLAAGDAAQLEQLAAWLAHGPPGARVAAVERDAGTPVVTTGFAIR
jgi:acylphosphatase